jgi:hypothetical protein
MKKYTATIEFETTDRYDYEELKDKIEVALEQRTKDMALNDLANALDSVAVDITAIKVEEVEE